MLFEVLTVNFRLRSEQVQLYSKWGLFRSDKDDDEDRMRIAETRRVSLTVASFLYRQQTNDKFTSRRIRPEPHCASPYGYR